MATFNTIDNADLKLKYYSYIDTMYCQDAENDIKIFFSGLESFVKYKNFDEIVAIKPSLLKLVDMHYKRICEAYSGHITDLTKQLSDMKYKMELMEEKHKRELDKANNDLALQIQENKHMKEKYEKDILIAKYEKNLALEIQKNASLQKKS